jgi:glutamine cyclotransferase
MGARIYAKIRQRIRDCSDELLKLSANDTSGKAFEAEKEVFNEINKIRYEYGIWGLKWDCMGRAIFSTTSGRLYFNYDPDSIPSSPNATFEHANKVSSKWVLVREM